MGKFAIDNLGSRDKNLKFARKRISKRNKERDFKGNQQTLKGIKLSPAGKTLGGLKTPKGSFVIVTTRRK